MRYSRSGENTLSGGSSRLPGNAALRMLPLVPPALRGTLVRRYSIYQVFGDTAIGDQQGASSMKWTVMSMPSDLTG